MSRFDRIVGHDAAVALLRRMLQRERLPHALLFHGPQGVGKSTLARALAATLLCTVQADGGCGDCESCRLLERGSHPDFVFVQRRPKVSARVSADTPIDEVDPADLSYFVVVDQIRDIVRLAGLAPRHSSRRVFLIDPADRMNAEAQNALLKTLEEPPGSSVLILIATRPQLLLPTVRSRCFAQGLSTLPTDELAATLQAGGMPAAEARLRAALSSGCMGRALELDLERRHERRERILLALERLTADPPPLQEIAASAAALAGKDRISLLEGLDLFEELLRDAARAAAGATGGLVHVDVTERLDAVGRRLGAPRAAALVGSVERMRGLLRVNVNATIAAESLLASVAGGPLP